MRPSRRVPNPLILLVVSCLLGCRPEPPADGGAAFPARTLITAKWDTAWVRGGTPSDTLLLLPIAMAADDARTYVLDVGARRVVAFRSTDGALLWTAGRRGTGPGEFSAANAIAVTPAREILVYDHRALRITVLDTLGNVAREIPTPEVGYIQSMCPFQDGSMLVSTLSSTRPLVHLAGDGNPVQRLDLPWAELADVQPIARQAGMASIPHHERCVLALSMGSGFAVFRGSSVESKYPYVEQVRPPDVEIRSRNSPGQQSQSVHLTDRTIAATDVVADESLLYTSFQGATPARGRVIDMYDLRTGEYRGSYGFQRPIARIARSGGVFLILHQTDGYPALLAARPALTASQRSNGDP